MYPLLNMPLYLLNVPLHLPPSPQKFAQSIFYPLLKLCFNQIRYQWGSLPHGTAIASAAPPAAGLVHSLHGGTGGTSDSSRTSYSASASSPSPSSPSSSSSSSSSSSPPWLGPQRPVVRMAEAEALLRALRSAGNAGASTSGRVLGGGTTGTGGGVGGGGGGGASAAGRNGGGAGRSEAGGASTLLSVAPESVNWQQHAVMLYRDMVTTGVKPGVKLLDMLLGCLRLKHSAREGEGGGGGERDDPLPLHPSPTAPSHLSVGSLSGHHRGPPGASGLMLGGAPSLGSHVVVGRQPWEAPLLAAGGAGASQAGEAAAPPVGRSGQRYETGFDKR